MGYVLALHLLTIEVKPVRRWMPPKLSVQTSVGTLSVEVPVIGRNFKLGLRLIF